MRQTAIRNVNLSIQIHFFNHFSYKVMDGLSTGIITKVCNYKIASIRNRELLLNFGDEFLRPLKKLKLKFR